MSGLRGGVDTSWERLDLPVQVDFRREGLPAEVEASAYFIVAEALTNVMKHSRASHAEVTASVEDDVLQVDVREATASRAWTPWHGLRVDRPLTALGGQLTQPGQAARSFPASPTLQRQLLGTIPGCWTSVGS